MNIYTNPEVEKFILALEKQTVAKVIRTVDLLEKFEHKLGLPHSKKVSKDLFELRIRGKQEIRLFYCFHNKSIHLLNGFVKKSQKIPKKELNKDEGKRLDII